MNTISFMTANYVARQIGYHMTEGWGQGDRATNDHFRPVETFGERFDEYLRDIVGLGFGAVDIWTSIINPEWYTDEHLTIARDLLQKRNLRVASIAGWMGSTPQQFEATCKLATTLGAPVLGGGTSMINKDRAFVVDKLREHGLKWGFENHPDEKTPGDVLAKIGTDDAEVVGVCLDTGWFGTHGYDGARAIEELAPRLFHIHLKDVRAVGGHDTCRYGEGVIDIRGCVETLKRIGYGGAISVEHEPDLFDPSEDVRASYEMLKGWLAE